MRNIELKARLRDRRAAEEVCKRIEAVFQGDIHQVDTYFTVMEGRLKLREADPGHCELVYYKRPDIAGPKGCDYQLEPVRASLKPVLEQALGVVAVVTKSRRLYRWKNVRIHLDDVEDLGAFIEFEAVQDPAMEDRDGFEKLDFLIDAFEIGDDDHEEYSYLELLAARAR